MGPDTYSALQPLPWRSFRDFNSNGIDMGRSDLIALAWDSLGMAHIGTIAGGPGFSWSDDVQLGIE